MQKEEAAIEALKKSLTTLNGALAGRTYLVGDAVTLADIIVCCNLYHGFTKVFDAAFRKPFPHVERYFVTCMNQPAFKKVAGDVPLCKEAIKPPAGGKAPAEAKPEKPAKAEKKVCQRTLIMMV